MELALQSAGYPLRIESARKGGHPSAVPVMKVTDKVEQSVLHRRRITPRDFAFSHTGTGRIPVIFSDRLTPLKIIAPHGLSRFFRSLLFTRSTSPWPMSRPVLRELHEHFAGATTPFDRGGRFAERLHYQVEFTIDAEIFGSFASYAG